MRGFQSRPQFFIQSHLFPHFPEIQVGIRAASAIEGEKRVIRQTISCDICGAEKKETNHWFVALEQSGELRLGTWATFGKGRSGSKHLCGQTCLHKLVDDFMAGAMGIRPVSLEEEAGDPAGSPEVAEWGAPETFRGETARPASTVNYDREHGEFESSARLIPTPVTRAVRGVPAASGKGASVRAETRSTPGARVMAARATESKPAPRVATASANRAETASPNSVERTPSAMADSPRASAHGASTALAVVGLSLAQAGTLHGSSAVAPPSAAPAMTARETAAAASKADRDQTLQRRRAEAWERERARESRQLERQMNPMLRPRALEA